jgi:prophage regulatory protein
MSRMLREEQVRDLTGLSRSTRWRLERRGEFPKRVTLTARCVGWLESEVAAWLEKRAEERNG